MAARRPTHRRSSSASNVPAAPSQAAPPPPTVAVTKPRRRTSLSGGAPPLAGVVAVVDVRVGPEAQIDCSGVVADKMAELGAEIVKRFTPRVTHVVLSHLTDAWKDKIARWQSHLSVGLARRVDGRPELQVVTQLWVNACYVSKTRMAEKPFFPVSKAAAVAAGGGGSDSSGHLHLNGAMRQFMLDNPLPPPPPMVTPRSTFDGYNAGVGKSSSASKVGGASTSISSGSTNIANGSKNAGISTGSAAVSRRQTLDVKSVSADANERKPGSASGITTTTNSSNNNINNNANNNTTNTTTTNNNNTGAIAAAAPAAPLSRKAMIQFQFGAAAALAAATLGANALKRKRRALSMEPMASDAIQKLLTPRGANPTTPRQETAATTTTTTTTTIADGGAKKTLDLDAVLTPVSVETTAAKRRAFLSSAKRRKTMSEMPSATLMMPVLPSTATDPNPQKKLNFFQDDATDCVAESQSDNSEESEAKHTPKLPPSTSAADEVAASRNLDPTQSSTAELPTEAIGAAVTAQDEKVITAAAADALQVARDTTPSDAVKSATTRTSPTERPSEPAPAAPPVAVVAVVTPVTEATATMPEEKASGELHVGVAGNPVRLTRTTRSAALKHSNASGAAAATVPVVAPNVWKCIACGCSNTRARRLCRDCRASVSSAAAVAADTAVAAAKEAPTTAGRATRKMATAPEPATPPTPVRKRKAANLSSPPVTTRTEVFTQRILATPKTITKPAAPASKRQRLAAPGSTSSITTTAARKLPLAPPRTPARPSSQSIEQTPSAQTQRSKEATRSISVLEMTPVRVTESRGSKRPQSTASSSTTSNGAARSRNSSIASAADGRVDTDQLERIVTPQRVSSSSRRSTKSVENTPTKTPARAEKAGLASAARPVRSVIGITGVDLETRGVIECAVHAIDSSMVAEPGYRKARVVKSVDYSAAVTHLIVGEDTKRTIKVLFAIARGAWIVSEAWVFSSLEKEQWQPEEAFELAMYANKFARMHPERRQIFKAMKFFVGSSVEPSREVVQSLLQCAGGEICNQISVADVCICGDSLLFRRARRTGVRVVTAKWVFDSIGAMQLQDDGKYAFSTTSRAADE